ncbi:MAG: DUF6335 family protein [Blastocatellia bacterium]
MARKKKEKFIDMGRVESEKFEPSEEVKSEFDEAAHLGLAGQEQLIEKLRQHHSTSPVLSGGDVDAAWEDADVGEESVGGGNPTPDQSVVEELGKAMGVNYEEGEPLHTTEKLESRDEHRWELDPASSEGFDERMKHEGEYEEK